MPSIAQQDYIILEAVGDSNTMHYIVSASTLAQLQKYMDRPAVLPSILLHYRAQDGTDIGYGSIAAYNPLSKKVYITTTNLISMNELLPITYMGSIENCETLAILEEKSNTHPVRLRKDDSYYLYFQATGSVKTFVAVDGKYVTVTLNASEAITALEVTDTEIPDGNAFINITEDELMKLIGAPRIV